MLPRSPRSGLVLALGVALVLAGCSRAPATVATSPVSIAPLPGLPSPDASTGRPEYSKVMVIAEENKTYHEVLGGDQAPYLAQLAARYASAVNMDAGYPRACPSLAAYLLMTSGDRAGICDDADPAQHRLTGPSIFGQVSGAGRQWRNYSEAMTTNCQQTNDGRYLVRHSPAPYYVGERTRCQQWDVPLGTLTTGALHADLAAGTLPSYSFVTPDACNDMHGGGDCGPDEVRTGDTWLTRWMPQILSGPDYQAGRLVVIVTWDEGSADSNHIPTILIAPSANRLVVRDKLSQCSMLRLAEEILELPPLGCASTVPSPARAFQLT